VAKRRGEGYEDVRFPPAPPRQKKKTNYFNHSKDIWEIPQEYRLEWVKQIPPTGRDPEWLKALTPEQIEKLGKNPIRTEPKQEVHPISVTPKSAPPKPKNAKKTTLKIDKLNLERQMRKAKANTGATGKSSTNAHEPDETPKEE